MESVRDIGFGTDFLLFVHIDSQIFHAFRTADVLSVGSEFRNAVVLDYLLLRIFGCERATELCHFAETEIVRLLHIRRICGSGFYDAGCSGHDRHGLVGSFGVVCMDDGLDDSAVSAAEHGLQNDRRRR